VVHINREKECTTFIRFTLHPDGSTVSFYYSFYDRKPEPSAPKLILVARLPETVEHARQMIAVNGATRVAHGEQDFVSVLAGVLLCIAGPFILRLFGTVFTRGYPSLLILLAGHVAAARLGPVTSLLVMTGHQRTAALIQGGLYNHQRAAADRCNSAVWRYRRCDRCFSQHLRNPASVLLCGASPTWRSSTTVGLSLSPLSLSHPVAVLCRLRVILQDKTLSCRHI
jgi:hypothetical protein